MACVSNLQVEVHFKAYKPLDRGFAAKGRTNWWGALKATNIATSSMASGTVAFTRSDRSRPGSTVATRDVNASVKEDHSGESEGPNPTPMVKLATVTLTDQSTYHGDVNDGACLLAAATFDTLLTRPSSYTEGIPNGLGVLLSVFGSTYSGAMKSGKKHGEGVELQTNGANYSGEFRDGVASGYGVYVGTFGDMYIGQWEDGARHGIGVNVDAEAVMAATQFNMDEPMFESYNAGLSWGEDVQLHVLRAVLAETAATSNQELARQRHIDAVVQGMTTIGKGQCFVLQLQQITCPSHRSFVRDVVLLQDRRLSRRPRK